MNSIFYYVLGAAMGTVVVIWLSRVTSRFTNFILYGRKVGKNEGDSPMDRKE